MYTITQDNKIELKWEKEELINQFFIYKKGTNECIGSISYRGYHYNQHLGDIGCVIYMEHRKKGYAYEAYNLISKLLNEKGIPDFWVTCNRRNTASIKLIMHHNGIIEQKFITDDIILFRCKTKQKEKNIYKVKKYDII